MEQPVEPQKRGMWIVAAVVVIVMCCCVLAGTAAIIGLLVSGPLDWTRDFGGSRTERSFDVGGSPSLQVDNFAGRIGVRAGEPGEIRVVATKKGIGLDQSQVEMVETNGGLEIRTTRRSPLGNASVLLEITVPTDTELDLHTGAGEIDVRGVGEDLKVDSGAGRVTIAGASGRFDVHTGAGSINMTDVSGEIKADSGAGSIDLRQAAGVVDLYTGSGSITYQGALEGVCRFRSGAGSITLRLPANLDMDVDLDTGMGTIMVEYPVDGQVSKREVKGVVGDGGQGSIYAHTGTGSIDILAQ